MLQTFETPRIAMPDFTIVGAGSGHGFLQPGKKGTPFLEYGPLAWLRADMGVVLSGGYVQTWGDWPYPGRTTPIRNYYTLDPLARQMQLMSSPPRITFSTNGQLVSFSGNWFHNPPFSIMTTYVRTSSTAVQRILFGGTNSYFTPYYPTGPTSRFHSWNPANNYTLDTAVAAPVGQRISSVISFDGNSTSGTIHYFRSGGWQSDNAYTSDGLNRWEEYYIGRHIYYEGEFWWVGSISEIIWLPIAADEAVAARYEAWSLKMWN